MELNKAIELLSSEVECMKDTVRRWRYNKHLVEMEEKDINMYTKIIDAALTGNKSLSKDIIQDFKNLVIHSEMNEDKRKYLEEKFEGCDDTDSIIADITASQIEFHEALETVWNHLISSGAVVS